MPGDRAGAVDIGAGRSLRAGRLQLGQALLGLGNQAVVPNGQDAFMIRDDVAVAGHADPAAMDDALFLSQAVVSVIVCRT